MQSLVFLSLSHPIEIEWGKLVNLERIELDSDKYVRGLSALKTLRKLLMVAVGQEGFQEITALENLDSLDIGGRRFGASKWYSIDEVLILINHRVCK